MELDAGVQARRSAENFRSREGSSGAGRATVSGCQKWYGGTGFQCVQILW
jgi:hypothetical protein